MAIDVTLDSVVTGYNLGKINVNFTRLDTALQDGISRSGSSPNNMNSAFDMNGYQILNLPTPTDPNDVIRLQDLGAVYTESAAITAALVEAEASATAAALSETNASDSEDSAAASAVTAAASEKSIGWTYDDTTSMADPGDGLLRFNNATLSSVTAIAVDANDVDSNDVSDYTATWGSSTNTNKGTITVRKVGSSSFFATYNVTAAVTDNSGWLQMTVAYVAGTGTISDGDVLYLHFTRSGDQGSSGGGSGDLVSTNNLSDVASAATSRTNLGLGALATQSSVAAGQVNNDVIDTDQVINDAITLAKMASGVAGGLPVYNASGNPSDVGAGTSGQVLTSNGSAKASWQDIDNTSQWVLLSSTTPTAVGTIDFTFDETAYSDIRILGQGIIPASDGRTLYMRIGHSNGSTILTSTRYMDFSTESTSERIPVPGASGTVGSSAGEGIAFDIQMSGFYSTITAPIIDVKSVFASSAGGTITSHAEKYTYTEADNDNIDTIRLYWSAGNFETVGQIYVYGLKVT